ncbi:MAG TPA: hypothetical protein VNP92_13740, partial [Actinophytocola sp.]|nr:hypothetical protein [Actinophytocola sp.]
MRKRTVIPAIAVAAALAASLVGAVSASAGSAAAATPPSLADFRLAHTNTDLPGVVADLDGQLPKLGVQNILAQANRVDAPKGPDCTSPALSTNTLAVKGKFC